MRYNNNNLLISKISSTCFGQISAHLQERKTENFYSIWYSVLLLWKAGVRRTATWHYVYGMEEVADWFLRHRTGFYFVEIHEF
jgi:hypothetical protein